MKKHIPIFVVGFFALLYSLPSQTFAENIPVLLDCDTANEIDDLYAIVRGLVEPEFEIVGLTSAHWRTQPNAPKDTVRPSQKLNEELLRLMGRMDIPHPMGASDMMKDAVTPQDSEAARFIIKKANEIPAGEKLTIITTGTVTNMASAILMDPGIITKVRCYSMGLRFENEKWNTKEFNAGNDLNAIDCLFCAKNFEWHVMTSTASRVLRYKKQKAIDELKGKGGAFDFILDYWLGFDPPWKPGMDTDNWIMWDVAAVEAVVHPEFGIEKQVVIPSRLKMDRKVWVYTRINALKMQADFWEALKRYKVQQ